MVIVELVMTVKESLWYKLHVSFVWVLPSLVAPIICWQEQHCDILNEVYFPLVAFCLTFRSFLLSLIVFTPTCTHIYLMHSRRSLRLISQRKIQYRNSNCTIFSIKHVPRSFTSEFEKQL